MSLYRQPGGAASRTVALAASVALVIGLLAGFVVGWAAAPDPTLADKVGEVRAALAPARQGIELTPTEYGQAVRGGQVVAGTEYAAAQADVRRVRGAVAAVREDLRALGPARAAALERAVAALGAAVERRAPPEEVRVLSESARRALGAAVGR